MRTTIAPNTLAARPRDLFVTMVSGSEACGALGMCVSQGSETVDKRHRSRVLGTSRLATRWAAGDPAKIRCALMMLLGETFYRFDQAGRVLFACHFPGHFAYGMHGWVIVDNP